MNNRNGLQIVAVLLAIIFVVTAAIAGVFYVLKNGSDKSSTDNTSAFGKWAGIVTENVDEKRNVTLQDVESISVQTVSDNITIVPADTDEVTVHYYGSFTSSHRDYKPELVVNKAGRNLAIQINYPTGINSISINSDLKLDVTIPEQYAGELSVKSTSGQVSAENLKLERIEYKNVSGDLDARGIQSSYIQLEATSGNVKIEGQFEDFNFKTVSGYLNSDYITAKNAKLETVSGDIRLSGQTEDVEHQSVSGNLILEYTAFTSKIKARTTSGEVSIKLPENAGFRLDFSSTSGDSKCDFPITLASGTQKPSNMTGTVGNGEGSIHVNTISGSLKIKK